MSAALLQRLSSVDRRLLRAAPVALLLLVALECWLLVLRAPLAELRALVALRQNLQSAAEPDYGAEIARQKARLSAVEALLQPTSPVGSTAQGTVLHLIRTLDRLAAPHGVRLGAVQPGTTQAYQDIVRTDFEVQAQGSFAALSAWLADVEREVAPLVITELSLRAGVEGGRIELQLRISDHRTQHPTPPEAAP